MVGLGKIGLGRVRYIDTVFSKGEVVISKRATTSPHGHHPRQVSKKKSEVISDEMAITFVTVLSKGDVAI